jgi:hypothetical protein
VKRFAEVLEKGGCTLVDDYLHKHAGSQCYLLVLDPQMDVVRDFLEEAAPGHLAGLEKLITQSGGPSADENPPLFVAVVSRQAGIRAARYFAKNEDDTQASLDTLDDDAVGIGVLCNAMKVFRMPKRPSGSAAAEERARRKARSRRHAE